VQARGSSTFGPSTAERRSRLKLACAASSCAEQDQRVLSSRPQAQRWHPMTNASIGRCKRTRAGEYLGRHLVRKGNLDEVGGRALLLALFDAHAAGGLPCRTKHTKPFHSRQLGRAASSASHARTHRQRSHAVWKAGLAGEAMSPAQSPTCWVAFTEPSVFFFDIFSCSRRCARLSCGAGATTSASAEVCMRRSPHVARRERIDARPRGAGEKAVADITCRARF
jgi:hypothetical protein